MFSLIELVANGTFNQILIDGSILVRIDNFQAIFSQMSEGVVVWYAKRRHY